MPAWTSTSTTVSPAAGLPVVLLVTVPVTVAACARAPANSRLVAKVRNTNWVDFIFVRASYECDNVRSLWRRAKTTAGPSTRYARSGGQPYSEIKLVAGGRFRPLVGPHRFQAL